ncbi:leader peptidase [Microcella alkaliphila]|uniref:Leader peptidase n=1 Tax=Microcella alkaliphila TaxID=279828 RepID=A0A0U5BIH0_9MICO|nr:leader peptidase [Microcella alkaliphila]
MGEFGPLAVTGAVILGAAIGSFLNVVIHRVPAGLSVVRPASACPTCETPIRARDNVPVASWLLLRGRCRACRAPISRRYPLIEAGTAVAFGLVAWWLLSPLCPVGLLAIAGSFAGVAIALLVSAYFWLAAVSIALTAIDLDTHRLPNSIVLPGYAVAAIGLYVPALLMGDVERVATSLAGAGILFAVYFLLWFVKPGGMGLGDVKLAGVLGAFLGFSGWAELAVGGFGAFLLGGIVSVGLLVTNRATRKSGIPFGPWMIAGCWLGLVVGTPIASAYLSVFGIGT